MNTEDKQEEIDPKEFDLVKEINLLIRYLEDFNVVTLIDAHFVLKYKNAAPGSLVSNHIGLLKYKLSRYKKKS